jgi:hypothetical protein
VSAGFLLGLSEFDIQTQAYYNKKILAQRGDFFADLKIERLSVDYALLEGVPAWENVATRLLKQDPEFIFANTFQRDGIAKWLTQFDRPILGVVHNPDILKLSDHAMSLVSQGKVFAYGLAPHVVSKITRTIPELEGRCAVYHPVFWMRPKDDQFAPAQNCRRIFLAGAVDYKNRDFERLVAFLARDGLQTDIPIVFQVCTGGPDRKRLEQDIADFGLQRFFELTPLDPQTGRVPHAVYLRSLRSCDAVMPLLPQERKDYLFNKYSTGIAAGIGSMRPIIAPKIYGEVYGFPALEPALHNPVDISALDLSLPRLLAIREEMKAIWTRAMAENQVAISRGLATLGLRAG